MIEFAQFIKHEKKKNLLMTTASINRVLSSE